MVTIHTIVSFFSENDYNINGYALYMHNHLCYNHSYKNFQKIWTNRLIKVKKISLDNKQFKSSRREQYCDYSLEFWEGPASLQSMEMLNIWVTSYKNLHTYISMHAVQMKQNGKNIWTVCLRISRNFWKIVSHVPIPVSMDFVVTFTHIQIFTTDNVFWYD